MEAASGRKSAKKSSRQAIVGGLLAAGLALFSLPAAAATKTWIATGGTAASWSTAGNWGGNPPGAPRDGDAVIFNSGTSTPCNIDVAPASLASLTITSYTGTIAATGGAKNVTVTGAFTMGSATTSPSLTGLGTVTVAGNFTLDGGTFGASSLEVTGNFSQSRGTFNSGATLVSVSGTFGQTGGTFNAPTSMKLGNAVTRSGGTFVHQSGTVILNGTAAVTHAFGDTVFNNLTLNDGMIAYWRLNESAGPTAIDSTGNGFNLTHTNSPTVIAGVASTKFYNPQALQFSATQYLTGSFSNTAYPAGIKPGTDFSMAAWVKLTSFGSSGNSCVGTTGPSADVVNIGGNVAIRLCAVNANANSPVKVALRHGGIEWVNSEATFTLGDGLWHHVGVRYDGTDGGKANAYLDGIGGTAASDVETPTYASPTVVTIARDTSGNRILVGSVDDVRIYNRAFDGKDFEILAAGALPTLQGLDQSFNSTVDVDGDLTLASGALKTINNNSVFVGGSFLNFGAVYEVAGSGTTTLNATTASREILTTHKGFSSLVLDRGGVSGSWVLRNRLYVSGTLAVTAGALDSGGYKVNAGNISKGANGSFTHGGGTVTVSGTGTQTMTPPGSFSTLKVEPPTETGLVAYWKFDDVTGPVVKDWSGAGQTGNAFNAAGFVSDAASSGFDNAGALRCQNGPSSWDGMSVTSTASTLPALSAAQTIAFWVKYTSTSTADVFMTFYRDANNALKIGKTGGNFYVRSDGDVTMASSAVPAGSENTWKHLAVVIATSSPKVTLYVDGVNVSAPAGSTPNTGALTQVRLCLEWTGVEGPGWFTRGLLDDVRVYDRGLTGAQVANLAGGRYAGTGSSLAVTSLGADTTVLAGLTIHNGKLATSTRNLTVTGAAVVDGGGILSVGGGAANVATFNGGLTVRGLGTLDLNTSGATVVLADGTTLIVDGTLDASTAGLTRTIRAVNASNAYTFTVGSTASATPTLNINGLAVQDVDGTNGMNVNAAAGASTTFTKLDNVAFSGSTGARALQVTGNSLTLHAHGLSFDNATAKNFKLTGTGSKAYVGATCGGTQAYGPADCESLDEDDDNESPPNGVADGGGAVIQWTHKNFTDTPGTIVDFPVSVFDWTNFAPRGVYAAYNGATPTIYVRNTDGTANFSWTLPQTPTAQSFVGAPRWVHDTAGGAYYVFILTSIGNVYKLQDLGGSFVQIGTTFRDGSNATATSTLSLDNTNLYWAGGSGSNGSPMLFRLPQTMTGATSVASAAVSANPFLVTVSSTTYLFSAANGFVQRMTSALAVKTGGTQPSSTVSGRVTVLGTTAYFVENNGKLWAVDVNVADNVALPTLWSYQDVTTHGSCSAASNCTAKNLWVNAAQGRVYYGDYDGHVYAVRRNGAGGEVISSGYPFRPGTSADHFETAPLYRNGVIAIGATTGRVFFIDQQNASNQPALIRAYDFGPNAVSAISYRRNTATTGEYMVGTEGGRLYYIDASTVADPTTSNN